MPAPPFWILFFLQFPKFKIPKMPSFDYTYDCC